MTMKGCQLSCCALSKIVAMFLLLNVCGDVNAQGSSVEDGAFDMLLLAQICRSQYTVDQCPPKAYFCSQTSHCPQQQVCSCRRNCGNLTCVLPDTMKLCGCHPVPRDGYILQRPEEIKFLCDKGFRLVGLAQKHCVNGQWEPDGAFPHCQIVECGPLPVLANGELLLNSANNKRTYNTTAKLRCNIGYTLVGDTHTRCQADGTWSPMQASCRRDGVWQPWLEWSACDAQCSSGLQQRTRTCQPPEEGGKPCEGSHTSEIQVCHTGFQCEAQRLNCYDAPPWEDKPVPFGFNHPSLRGNIHRCLHHCKNSKKNYGAVRGEDCWCFNKYKTTGVAASCPSDRVLYQLYPAPQGHCTKLAQVPDGYVVSYSEYYLQSYTTSCGWLGWSRCRRTRTLTRSATRTAYRLKTVVVKC